MREQYHNYGNVCEFDSKDWGILKEFNHYSLILHYKHASVRVLLLFRRIWLILNICLVSAL